MSDELVVERYHDDERLTWSLRSYIGSEKAIADLPFFEGNVATGGALTYLFWVSRSRLGQSMLHD